MTTILRVKRRLEDNPVEALLLQCKRAKIEGKPDAVPSVFVFSGTVTDEDKDDSGFKKVILKEKNRNATDKTKDISSILSRLKEDKKSSNRENRLKIVNYSRGLSLNGTDKDENPTETVSDYSIVDIYNMYEKVNDEEKYAYDLYFCHKDDVRIENMVDIESVYPIETELVFNDYRGGGVSDDETDDEDSNIENHWRNEYPDTEDDSIDDDDIVRAVNNMDLGNDLSSEDDEEIVYGYTTNSHGKVKLNKDDVDRYGPAYAKYKMKILNNDDESDDMPKLIGYDDSEVANDDSFYYPKNDDGDDRDRCSCSGSSKDSDIDNYF